MGSSQSNNTQLQPAREPMVLLNTGAGVIVRIPDPVNGDSIYQHNHRVGTAPTPIVRATHDLQAFSTDQQNHIAVVKPGDQNQALKGSIVYLKKPPRRCAPPAHRS